MREIRIAGDPITRSRTVPMLLALIVVLTIPIGLSPQKAEAKGPIEFRVCGSDRCITRKNMRFTAAMLYGGRLHTAPACGTRVHSVVARIPRSARSIRYLVVASRGLIGKQGREGYVWWHQVRGDMRKALIDMVAPSGKGIEAGPDPLGWLLSLLGRGDLEPWRIGGSRVVTCASIPPPDRSGYSWVEPGYP